MYEQACEPYGTCNTDNYSFKAYFARWLAAATKYAPYIRDGVMTRLRASAVAAAQQCSGGPNSQMCGMKWTNGKQWDNTMGVGQQMGALAIIQANLIDEVFVPVTNKTGGTSQGNPNAGGGTGNKGSPSYAQSTITRKDKAGAGILTTLVLISVVGGSWWMIA